jgi:hypothetical protein
VGKPAAVLAQALAVALGFGLFTATMAQGPGTVDARAGAADSSALRPVASDCTALKGHESGEGISIMGVDLHEHEDTRAIVDELKRLCVDLDKLRDEVRTHQHDEQAGTSLELKIARLYALQQRLGILRQICEHGCTSLVVDVKPIAVALEEQRKALQAIADALAQIHIGSKEVTLNVNPTAALAPPTPAGEPPARQQIDPNDPVRKSFPRAATIDFAVVSVPDPRVPRLRRSYDNMIVALSIGMLGRGYVLDRYGFPWSKEMRAATKAAEPGSALELADDGRYGVALYRRDRARFDGIPGIDIFALYLVPEVGSYGIAASTLRKALRAIGAQVPATTTFRSPVPGICGENSLLLVGPVFSGSMASLTSAAGDVLPLGQLGQLCVVTSSATAASNTYLVETETAWNFACGTLPLPLTTPRPSWSTYLSLPLAWLLQPVAPRYSLCMADNPFGSIDFHAQTADDATKLKTLERFLESRAIGVEKVAVLYEGTTFGERLCSASNIKSGTSKGRDDLCRQAALIPFPANIADVRYGEQIKRNELAAGDKSPRIESSRLALEQGAENGSEFLESQQSPLTASSAELQLDAVFGQLRQMRPQVVVVAATDVRDRLFLFDRIRRSLPNTLLIDFETDNLLAHPEFIHATRGAVTLSSVSLQTDRKSNCVVDAYPWATDWQKLAARVLAGCSSKEQQPVMHVVTREGLRSLQEVRLSWRDKLRAYLPPILAQLSTLAAFVFFSVWSRPAPIKLSATESSRPPFHGRISLLQRLAEMGSKLGDEVKHGRAGSDPFDPRFIGLVAPLVAAAAGYSAALSFSIAVGALYIWLMIGCCRRLMRAHDGNAELQKQTGPQVADRSPARTLAFGFTVIGITLAGVCVAISFDLPSRPSGRLHSALLRLGLDPVSGVACNLNLIVAALLLSYTGASLTVIAGVDRRNACLIRRSMKQAGLDGTACDLREFLGSQGLTLLQWRWLVIAAISLLLLFSIGAVSGWRYVTQPSVFGPLAPWSTLLASLATSVAALGWIAVALGLARRLRRLSDLIFRRWPSHRGVCGAPPIWQPPRRCGNAPIAEHQATAASSTEIPGLWARCDTQTPLRFPVTPMSAKIQDIGSEVEDLFFGHGLARWQKQLDVIFCGGPDTTAHRFALYALLASEISSLRWAGFNAAVCALGGVGLVYLFPVIGGDLFILGNLAMLVLIAGISCYYTAWAEQDQLLSNLLSNRRQRRELSASLLGHLAQPILAILAALAIAAVPGVREWGGGLFPFLLHFIGRDS